MVRPNDLVVSLYDVDRNDTPFVGGKGANLGEMLENDFPVPPGFVITSTAYFEFLKENNLDEKIKHLLSAINFEREESLNQGASHIQKLIRSGKISEKLVGLIFASYEKIGSSFVAIRSSATSEDSKDASFAGQNETFLNIRGEATLAEKTREAWSSLFEPRSIFYRHEKKLSHLKNGIALVVQKMVESETSGIMFTVDPVTGDKSKVIIEAVFGLGEYIVQGKVTPDHYEVDKKTLDIIHKSQNSQDIMLKKQDEKNREVKVPLLRRRQQKIKDHEIIALAKLGIQIEKHYYFPQDIEWASEKNRLYIVQTRPITTLNQKSKVENQNENIGSSQKSVDSRPLLVGDPASPGIGVGKVRKLKSSKESGRLEKGEILVVELTSPDFVPAMKRASAIITEKGGRTSHAAIVSREFGIPAIVGASQAFAKLKDNQVVTVNGKTGEVFAGAHYFPSARQEDKFSTIKTKTKVYVNLAEPELAASLASRNVDGVGLLRAEFMIAQIGVHPKKLIHDNKSKIFIDELTRNIGKICDAFYPRPVFYRTTDFKTNEYRNLIGGKQFEGQEGNPMIGYRGAYRYINDPKVFELELRAVKNVREKLKLNNLNLLIPFVRTPRELEEVKKIVNSQGLRRSTTFKLFMMCEVPSNVILIEDFIAVGIDGVSIGSNDLTMLTLGVDRDNEEIAKEFDERNKAVLWSIARVIKACQEAKIDVSICGQAPSVFPSLVEELVSFGIDSISVSRDAIDDTRRIVHFAEKLRG